MSLNDAEQALIKQIAQFARDFAELPPLHPADAKEMAFHVHALPGSWRCAPLIVRTQT